ncbi:uncharacterized protein SCHCODRAFT_02643722 [Schizophyllum commune H4-8]|nr:uncharacterized protein SCHCODRAFT_02643722 [Schizophyllum commune H4-8]KAI5885535.1 hypothetical protein SCHCODRAFT_02643722 [Schizophyllum commune H4-8]
MRSNLLSSFCAAALLASTAFAQLRTLPYNFTLAALNTTLPNVNDTGVPLVLGLEFVFDYSAIYFTSTYASAHNNTFPSLGLLDGALHAYGRNDSWDTNAVRCDSGDSIGWFSTENGPPGADVFSVIPAAQDRQYPTFAVHEENSLWSLCSTGNDWGLNEVYYNISPTNIWEGNRVVVEDCYKVTLQVLPLE